MKLRWKHSSILMVFMGAWLMFYFIPSNHSYPNLTNLMNKILKKQFWYDDLSVISRTSNCEKYFKQFVPVLDVDDEYTSNAPLAFSHLVHTQSAILEVFLSLYFRPNNFHCIHVDKKSNARFKKAIDNLVRCYSTKTKHGKIFILSEVDSFSVDWGGNTMLKADLTCLSKLLLLNQRRNHTSKWTHSISLAGSELPIVTYSSFRDKITQKLGTSLSSVESILLPQAHKSRFSDEQIKDRKTFLNQEETIFEIPIPLANLSNASSSNNSSVNKKINFKIFKGLRNVILSSNDVNFLLNNAISKELLKWFSKGSLTEEHFYSTAIRFNANQNSNMMIQNTSAKKTRINSGDITFTSGNTLHGICPRFTEWNCSNCSGECFHSICNFNITDLYKVSEDATECLIANKFNLNVDSSAVSQQWINILTKMSKEMKSTIWEDVLAKISSLFRFV